MRQFPSWNTWIILTLLVTFCGRSFAVPLDAPGACDTNDEKFNTEQGGCLNFNGGIVWGMSYPGKVTQAEAKAKCKLSREEGFSDWRLPFREDFRRAIESDARKHLSLSPHQFYWTDSQGDEAAWAHTLVAAEEKEYVLKTEVRSFVCVRRPVDSDSDGVPDSSDHCNRTKAGLKVATTDENKRKGCAENDVLMRAGTGCRIDDENFESAAPRGCRDKRSGLVWSNEIKEPASWYQAIYEYCEKPWRIPTARELQRVGSQRSLAQYFSYNTNQNFWTNEIHNNTSLVFVNLETGLLGTQHVNPWSRVGGTYDFPGTGYYTGIRATYRAAICVR